MGRKSYPSLELHVFYVVSHPNVQIGLKGLPLHFFAAKSCSTDFEASAKVEPMCPSNPISTHRIMISVRIRGIRV